MIVHLALRPVEFLVRRGIGGTDVLTSDRYPLYEPMFSCGIFEGYDRLNA
jgi:hypothetical protein